MARRILISAGEASGELYGAQLIPALRAAAPGETFEFFGLGGEQMHASGCRIIVDSSDVAVVGLVEVLRHLPSIYGKFRKLVNAATEQKPDAAILIDFPDFNLRLAREMHRRGVPVIYFVSPQLWAWRQSRISQVKKYVKKMLVIFPFEDEFYREHGVAAEYVGHPLADLPPPNASRKAFADEYNLDPAKQWIALLPGSRKQEVERNLPAMLGAIKTLGNGYEYVLPVASTLDSNFIALMIMKLWVGSTGKKERIVFGDNARAALAHSRAAIVASGTATVEAALIGNPFVVVYRVAPLTWFFGRRLVNLKNFAMVNLIAGKTIVPELIQDEFTAENIVRHLRPLLEEGPERAKMVTDLATVRERLKPGVNSAAERAAKAILREMGL